MWVPGYCDEVYAPPVGRGGQGLLQRPAHGSAHRGLQWVHWAVMGCGTAYTVKGPTARWMWRGMMVRRSATRAVPLSP